jgi:hypothetical protein
MPAPACTQLELHRAALIGHCYRMLGSKTWLCCIAANVCLDALALQNSVCVSR